MIACLPKLELKYLEILKEKFCKNLVRICERIHSATEQQMSKFTGFH
jgi:hypothetical protein